MVHPVRAVQMRANLSKYRIRFYGNNRQAILSFPMGEDPLVGYATFSRIAGGFVVNPTRSRNGNKLKRPGKVACVCITSDIYKTMIFENGCHEVDAHPHGVGVFIPMQFK